MTRAKAIKLFCFDCAGESAKEVTLCEITGCSLWPYRTGQSPESKVYQKRMLKAQSATADKEQSADSSEI
jgi:hypothetical protein